MKISTNKLKSIMWARLLTQEQLAKLSGISRATVNSTLAKGSCSIETAGKIANALDIKPSEFVGVSDDE